MNNECLSVKGKAKKENPEKSMGRGVCKTPKLIYEKEKIYEYHS